MEGGVGRCRKGGANPFDGHVSGTAGFQNVMVLVDVESNRIPAETNHMKFELLLLPEITDRDRLPHFLHQHPQKVRQRYENTL